MYNHKDLTTEPYLLRIFWVSLSSDLLSDDTERNPGLQGSVGRKKEGVKFQKNTDKKYITGSQKKRKEIEHQPSSRPPYPFLCR